MSSLLSRGPDREPVLERRGVNLSRALLLDAENVLHALRLEGCRISFSALVETGVRELLDRSDIRAIVERHGACARRQISRTIDNV